MRSAVSRAYYSAHLKSRAHAEDVDQTFDPTKTDSVHSAVILHFRLSDPGPTAKNRKTIASELDRARNNRVRADYGHPLRDAGATAELTIKCAKTVFGLLKKCR